MDLFRSEEMQLCQVRQISLISAPGGHRLEVSFPARRRRCSPPFHLPAVRAAATDACLLQSRSNPSSPVPAQLMIPAEAAHDTIAALGEVGLPADD